MSARVLRGGDAIGAARRSLDQRGASALRGGVLWRWLSQHVPWIGAVRPCVGDRLKSWDIFLTVELIQQEVRPEELVVDLGCYASEILPSLYQLGYRNLAGVDLQRGVGRMPHAGEIEYIRGDLLSTPFAAGSVGAATAISVIEHGYAGERLFRELARILRPGGLFIASTDYWPEKIDTSAERLFGMDWRIFSRSELADMVALAGRHGLAPLGAADLDVAEPAIHWGGRDYTFVWFALRKSG